MGEMGDNGHIEQNHTGSNHANGTAGATSTASLATPGGNEERRPSAAFKPPPAPPEKQWDQKGVHYRSEGGVMHIHKSDSKLSKLSTGPGDENERQPLMSAPDDTGESSDDKTQETESVPDVAAAAAAGQGSSTSTAATTEATTATSTSTTNEIIDASETTAQVHVTVSVTEHKDQVITSTSLEGLKSVDASQTTETKQKLFTSTSIDGTRTQTGTELPEVANGNSSGGDPAAWV